MRALSSPKPVVVFDAPTGMGKSLLNNVYATSQHARYSYATVDRGLQDQVGGDFPNLFDVRGMQNYPCPVLPPKPGNNCDKGPCLDGYACALKHNGCPYYDRLRRAREEDAVLTNYALWLTLARKGEGLGQRDIAIFDEAHRAEEMVQSSMRLTFGLDETDVPPNEESEAWDLALWSNWAWRRLPDVKADLAGAEAGTQEYRALKSLQQRLEDLTEASGDWEWEYDEEGTVTLEPVWAAPYVKRLLFRGIPKVVLSSATLPEGALRYLGLQPEEYTYLSALSPFAAKRRPIIHVPTVGLSQGSTDEDMEKWLDTNDAIIEAELAEKGVFHVPSYRLATYVKRASRYGAHMLLPERRTTRLVVEQFKAMKAPAILLSPAVGEGYDFHGDLARWQIIGKLAFPPRTSRIVQRRIAEDRSYLYQYLANDVQQRTGRCTRTPEDWCRTYITDNHIQWLVKRRKLFHRSWLEAYQEGEVPRAGALLKGGVS